MSTDDDWQEVWDARVAALSGVLGAPDDSVFHAPVPFALGGNADVLAFPNVAQGVAYVTAELTGKPGACYADYELMIFQRSADNNWGPNVISRLAPYTQKVYIGPGETMDIDSATPAASRIKAFVFDTYATFRLFDQEFALRLCLGITKAELQFKRAHGSSKLIAALKKAGVYPFTDLARDDVPLGSQ